MKYCILFLFFGLAAQLDASVLTREANESDADLDVPIHKRFARNTAEHSEDEDRDQDKVESVEASSDGRKHIRRRDGDQDKVESVEASSDGRKHIRRRDGLPITSESPTIRRSADNNVLAFGLDTGAPDSKNGLVQAISDAFGGLENSQSPHVRSNAKSDKKKPLALELKSEALLRGLENFLASPKVKKITRDLARKAAIVYRAIEKEL